MFPARLRHLAALSAFPLLLPLAAGQGRYHWSETYDGPAGRSDEAFALTLGSQGEVFVCGQSSNGLDSDAVILAYDSHGQQLWERRIDLGLNEAAYRIQSDPASGALYAVGSGTATPLNSFVVRLDPQSGAIVWQQVYTGPQQQGALFYGFGGIAIDSGGGLVLGGYVGSSQHDVLVARYTSGGALSWTWSAPAPGSQYGYVSSLAIAPSGEIIVHAAEYAPGFGTQHTFHKLTAAGAPVWSVGLGATDGGCAGPVFDAASNIHYSINVSTIGGHRIAKLDPAGNQLWSVDAQLFFGANSSTYGLAVDVQGDVLASSSGSNLLRLDANGNELWTVGVPPTSWFDQGFYAGFALAANGDAVLRLRGHTPGEALDFDAVARFDPAGQFLWSQAVRAVEPGVEVQTTGMALAPQGSVVLAGYSLPVGSLSKDVFVAALHKQSQPACFGDGSSGPCPCSNNVQPGVPSGCVHAGSGLGARLDDQGIASLASDSLRFYAHGVIPNGVTVLLQGQVAPAPIAQQDGILCLSGSVLRLYASTPSAFWADIPAAASARVHAQSAALGDVLLPGSTRGYQVYYRGTTGLCAPGNGNFTNSSVVDWSP